MTPNNQLAEPVAERAIDPKALEAAHATYERHGQAGDLRTQRLSDSCLSAVIRAYLAALASPAAISGDGSVAVTAKMVEAAWNLLNRGGYRIDGSAVHAALTAALATAPEGKGGAE